MSDDASRFVGAPPPPPRKAPGLTRASRPAVAAEPDPDTTPAIDAIPAVDLQTARMGQVAAAVAPAAARRETDTLTAPVARQSQAELQQPGTAQSGEEFEVPGARRHRMKVTFELDSDLRMRARTMFKVTGDDEGDVSFGGMLATLIENECIRRERMYNGGRPFEGTDRRLRPGRPLG